MHTLTRPERIVIIGGGMAAMTTALELSARPDWQRHDLTIYQLGHRLGGKGASGRNQRKGDRIESTACTSSTASTTTPSPPCAIYREKAYELFNQHGYLTNITNSVKLVAPTPGYLHEGNDMGDEWNHSDDQLAFDTYWTLHQFALNEQLRKLYAAVVRDPFELEKHERIPIWNFVLAATGAKEFDVDGALWTLRRFPLDLISWSVRNSHLEDITKLPKSFRSQELAELLPPGERRMSRWNSHPFKMDGGEGGQIEYAGDEFLLSYWMGRYVKAIR